MILTQSFFLVVSGVFIVVQIDLTLQLVINAALPGTVTPNPTSLSYREGYYLGVVRLATFMALVAVASAVDIVFGLRALAVAAIVVFNLSLGVAGVIGFLVMCRAPLYGWVTAVVYLAGEWLLLATITLVLLSEVIDETAERALPMDAVALLCVLALILTWSGKCATLSSHYDDLRSMRERFSEMRERFSGRPSSSNDC